MFSDKNFSDPLGADKRGRAKKKKEKHMLQRYYKVGEGEDDVGGAGDETEAPPTSKVKDVGKGKNSVAKFVEGKKLGKSKELARPKFPGPLAPSKLALYESAEESDGEDDSGEETDLKPELKVKNSGKLTGKTLQGKKLRVATKGEL